MDVISDKAMHSFGEAVERNAPTGLGLGKYKKRELANNIGKSLSKGFMAKEVKKLKHQLAEEVGFWEGLAWGLV